MATSNNDNDDSSTGGYLHLTRGLMGMAAQLCQPIRLKKAPPVVHDRQVVPQNEFFERLESVTEANLRRLDDDNVDIWSVSPSTIEFMNSNEHLFVDTGSESDNGSFVTTASETDAIEEYEQSHTQLRLIVDSTPTTIVTNADILNTSTVSSASTTTTEFNANWIQHFSSLKG